VISKIIVNTGDINFQPYGLDWSSELKCNLPPPRCVDDG
jgi:hypothetical protein